jgi:hypothetical protein
MGSPFIVFVVGIVKTNSLIGWAKPITLGMFFFVGCL